MTIKHEWNTVAADAVAGVGWFKRDGHVPLWAWVRRSDAAFAWSVVDAAGDAVAKGQTVGRYDDAVAEAKAAAGRFCPECGKRQVTEAEARAMELAEAADAGFDGGEWSRAHWAKQWEKFCSCDGGRPDGEYDLVARHYVGLTDDVRLVPVGRFDTRDEAVAVAAAYFDAFDPFDAGPFKDFLLGQEGAGLVATLGPDGVAL